MATIKNPKHREAIDAFRKRMLESSLPIVPIVYVRAPARTKPSLDVEFLGKTYKIGKNQKYKTIVQVAKELNVNVNDLKKYRDEKDKKRVFVKGTQSLEINLKNKKPLLLRDFGVSRISNQQLIKETNTIKRQGTTLKIFENVPDDVNLTVYIEGVVNITFSEVPVEVKIKSRTVVNNGDDISRTLILIASAKCGGISTDKIMVNSSKPIKITRNNQGGQTMRIENMILRDDMPPSIKNMYSNIIEDGKWKHCIHDYMAEIYKKNYGRKTLEKLNTTDDIYNFCVAKNIKMIAYDINGNCIKANYPTGEHKGVKNLFFIAYNNHLYPIKNQYLNKVNPIINNIEMIADCKTKIVEILEAGRYVSSVKLYGSEIVSFVDNDIKYICNDEYVKCKEILIKFGLADKIYDSIRIIGLGKILKELYIKTSDKSMFLGHERFVKGGFNYFNDELIGNITTIDANKFYPSCLRDLKFLITVDMVSDDLVDYEDGNLTLDYDHYLYIATPNNSSILMPDTNCYSGAHLKFCKNEGIEFTILEKLKTSRISNHYTEFINDLYLKLENKDFKDIINPFIGQFENQTISQPKSFDKFVNSDELTTVDNTKYIHKITNNLHMVCDVTQNVNIYNRKPIAIQLKDESRKRLYEIMKMLKLDDSNIKAIKTDAISYVSKSLLPKKYIGSGLGQWKYINFKSFNNSFNYTNFGLSFIVNGGNFANGVPTILGNCYAGAGKSHKIINEHIPSMGNDYIVLTPSHASLKEYKLAKLSCDVIQKYEYFHCTPTQNNIIVDELGMVSKIGLHLLIKWYYMGKRIIAYGDFNQLLPIGADNSFNSAIFTNALFFRNDDMTTNYRNNFTKDFYDDIIDGNLDNEAVIKFYNNSNSNNVICYRNQTCDKYNKLIATKLGIRDKFAVGAKIICNTNELRTMDIYNKYIFTIIEEADDYVILEGDIKMQKLVMNKIDNGKEYFTLAYARTLHSVQGESLPDLYFPDEDLEYVNNRFTYTLISRLKGTFPIYQN